MIYLASTSKTRAELLSKNNIDFIQILFDYEEKHIKKSNPFTYAYNVVNSKKEQFFKKYPNYDKVLFADSSVVVDNIIFGKAKNDREAYDMLLKQSDNFSSVITAMLYISNNIVLSNVSITTYKFSKFDNKELNKYISSKQYEGKAGAMMIEGFNKKYIISKHGHTSTAMGLNIEILKAYL